MGVQRLSTSGALTGDSVSYSSVKAGSIIPATVTGGTETILGDYVYKRFNASGTLAITNAALTCDFLVVAGGGAGGDGINIDWPGGGGGGGVLVMSNQVVPIGSYAVTVGAGGPATAFNSGSQGAAGVNSSIGALAVAVGGGGGGGRNSVTGGTGGSGGGGTDRGGGGAGTAGQGFAGGGGTSNQAGGGGGGSEPGGNKVVPNWVSTFAQNGHPGFGKNLPDFGEGSSSGVRYATSGYYYGSGGYGANGAGLTPIYAPGGAHPSISANGTVNSGGGSSGGRQGGPTSGAGGSGVVVVRYRRELVGL